MGFFEEVYRVVRQIPAGRVATYGQVALLAGNPRMARQVGWALHQNPDPASIPCHRVVNRFGGLSAAFAFGDGREEHRGRVEAEGIEVSGDYRVDLERFGWRPRAAKEPERL